MSNRNPASAPHLPLSGLRVLDLSRGLAGSLATLVLADYGAEVLRVEPPGGDELRHERAFPFWQRGKRSTVVDLASDAGRDRARRLADRSDVVVESFRPRTAQRLGLDGRALTARNPRLVHASITGFGSRGPLADWKGYEGIVLAKLGGMAHVAGMAPRPGPAFSSVPYASFAAAHTALHGILAALHERERSGLGQHVETSLAHALAAYDPWEWFLRIVCEKYPGAYTPQAPYSARGVPNQGFAFRLLVCLTKDGRWLQFSQTSPHLFREFMEVLGLAWMFDDPEWSTAPDFEAEAQRERFWELMLDAARQRTAHEWDEVFERHPNVWAELFRNARELLDHPQLLHNGQVIDLHDPVVGPTRQLAPFVAVDGAPPRPRGPAPALGADDALADSILAEPAFADRERPTGALSATSLAPDDRPDAGRAEAPGDEPERGARSEALARGAGSRGAGPLAGVTILELGLWYAAPFGTALLADLGARVIKVEPLTGEPMRHIMPFPDAGAVKVLQGKESVALDLALPEGRAIVRRIAGRCDLVLTSYRAGVAERLGVDAITLRRENPRLVYLNAPGYGADGPCARKPAFAPTIGAACGAALLQAGPSIPYGPALSMQEVKEASIRLNWAAQAPGNADGCAALGVATALLLGLLGRERGGTTHDLMTSMLATASYAASQDCIDVASGPEAGDIPCRVDPSLHGDSALYRLYPAAEGWVFLAAPQDREWASLCRALAPWSTISEDPRFRTPEARRENDAHLARALGATFARRPAGAWERDLLASDVACAEIVAGPIARALVQDEQAREGGYLCEVEHPTFGRHRRLAPIARLSRTPGEGRAAPTLGQHTRSVLAELGYAASEVERLTASRVIA